MQTIKRLEFLGTILIIAFGTSLHFWFEWTGYWRPVALIAAVNESTWEHFKMAFWPTLIWAMIEYPFLKNRTANFSIAKALGLLTMPAVTATLFYSYTALTGEHYLLADIVIFIVSIFSGQYVSYRVLTSPKTFKPSFSTAAISIIGVMTIAFSLLSYFPLENFLFAHPYTGEYGILEEYHADEHDHDH